jgi:hypothetical protein
MKNGKCRASKAAEDRPEGERIAALMARLQVILQQPGKRKQFAQALNAWPHQIAAWLSGRNRPGGETTLAIVEWINSEEPKGTL